MSRTFRQSKILEIINSVDIETQEELSQKLIEANFSVTQATISRDIKEMGLTKILGDNGNFKYAYIDAEQKSPQKLLTIFRESLVSVKPAGNLIVLRTLSAAANICASCIDKLQIPEILGCIAGDDTLLIIVENASIVDEIVKKIQNL